MNPLENAASGVANTHVRAVFRAHLDRIYGYLLYRLGGRVALAEELTRAVFTAHAGELRAATTLDNVEARLLSIARRELVAVLDGAARNPELVLGPDGVALLGASKAEHAALDHLELLPIPQRIAVTLRHVDELPVGLVAESTTLSVKATEEALAVAARTTPGFDTATLSRLDTSAAPDNAFATELEEHLVERAGAGGPRTSPERTPNGEAVRGATTSRDARFAPNQTPRLALAALAAFAIIALLVQMNTDENPETERTTATETPSTTGTSSPTTTSSSAAPTTTSTAPEASTPTSESAPQTVDETTTSISSSTAAVIATSTTLPVEQQQPLSSSDKAFLNRGPLSRRGGHQTLWTGAEMIVWGGWADDRTPLADGAAFDPRLNSWRSLAVPPVEPETQTTAVWAGDQMIVVAPDATLAYRQWLDDWVPLGDGIEPGPAIWTGRAIVLANRNGMSMFDLATGVWTQMPDPGIRQMRDEDGESFLMTDKFEFGLHMLGGDLYFVRGCGPNIWRWTGLTWSATARPQFSDLTGLNNVLFCAWANQTAVVDGRILVWSNDYHPSIIYDPQTDTWEQLANPPLPGTEGPVGGITLDDRVLAINWEAAVFDAETEQWTAVALPGEVINTDGLVWTGTELLAWGADNAWRTTLRSTAD